MKIRPLGNNILVEKIKDDQIGDFVVPIGEEELKRGVVVGIGKRVDEDIKVGDRIVYAKFSENEVGGYLLINQNDILGVYEN